MRTPGTIPILTMPVSLALACATLLALGACEGGRKSPAETRAEMAWARAHSTQSEYRSGGHGLQAGVFTVRDKISGDVRAVEVDELAAAPIAQLSARPAPASGEPTSAGAGSGAEEPVFSDDDSMDQSDAQEVPITEPLNYTIQRSGGQVKVSGPGVSIVSAGAQGPATARGEPGQRASDPIVCEGQRMMHIDNQRIFVDGDAITARNGCDLHITNSRIVASGTGVVVRDATAHISNSYIEGGSGAYDAGIGAKMFLRDATFNGVIHRNAFAQIQDQGGNRP